MQNIREAIASYRRADGHHLESFETDSHRFRITRKHLGRQDLIRFHPATLHSDRGGQAMPANVQRTRFPISETPPDDPRLFGRGKSGVQKKHSTIDVRPRCGDLGDGWRIVPAPRFDRPHVGPSGIEAADRFHVTEPQSGRLFRSGKYRHWPIHTSPVRRKLQCRDDLAVLPPC